MRDYNVSQSTFTDEDAWRSMGPEEREWREMNAADKNATRVAFTARDNTTNARTRWYVLVRCTPMNLAALEVAEQAIGWPVRESVTRSCRARKRLQEASPRRRTRSRRPARRARKSRSKASPDGESAKASPDDAPPWVISRSISARILDEKTDTARSPRAPRRLDSSAAKKETTQGVNHGDAS